MSRCRRSLSSLSPLLVSIVGVLLPASAIAHIELVSHTDRYGRDTQKQAPCGLSGGTGPGDTVYTYAPGATVTIAWHEFIDHPGHYRIAFDDQGDDSFVTPSSATDSYNSDAVLLDDIADLDGVHDYSVKVTLPEIECEQCTIQVIQVMTDKPPFGDGNDVYFHCIDVQLTADGDPTTGEPTTTAADVDPDNQAGCTCASGPVRPGYAALGLLGLLGLRRRRLSSTSRYRGAVAVHRSRCQPRRGRRS